MTALEIFKKHGAHYYDDDEEAIIDAMNEYAQQQIDYNLKLSDEEIEEEAKTYDNSLSSIFESIWMPQGFIEGAKWVRDKKYVIRK